MMASVGTAKGWIEKMEKSDAWSPTVTAHPDEHRFTHREGSVCRIFSNTGRDSTPHDACYTYPPGGTDSPTGPLERPPFAPKDKADYQATRALASARARGDDAWPHDSAEGAADA